MLKYAKYLILAVAVILAFKIRILNPWESVFTWTVRLSENDPWYYYRLIENCIYNFPNRIWFDPMTQYPFGTYTHFGPFLVYLSAIAGMLTNATNGEALRSVLVFIPAVGGIIAIFAVFFLAKIAFGERVALIASLLIAVMPGQFLHRSLLSFNDHHVWEVIWMIVSLTFFLHLIDKNFTKRSILFSVLGGISFSLYILTWAAGFAFGLLLIASMFFAIILRINIKKDIYKLSLIYFLSAALIFFPFAFNIPPGPAAPSPMQLYMILFYAAATFVIWQFDEKYDFLQKYVRIKKENAAIGLGLLALISIPTIFPEFSTVVGTIIGYLQPRGGALTIGEVYPFFSSYGTFTLAPAYYHFGFTFFFAVPAILYLAYRIYKHKKFGDLIMFLWAIALLIALSGQNRFAYYFAAVSAIYCSLTLHVLFEKLHLYKAFERKDFSYFRFAIAIFLAFIAIYPTYSLAEQQSQAAGALPKQWYDAMEWLRNNTPDTGYEKYYYELYTAGKIGEKYDYPFDTYGVISWWDYGHWILAIGKRMAVANPFQQGIGNLYDNIPGAAPFFVTQNESYAEWVADQLNVRYVVSDIEMATGKFFAMATWAEGDIPLVEKYYHGYLCIDRQGQLRIASDFEAPFVCVQAIIRAPGELYFNTMEAKLHTFDGSGLQHYRMIYESEPDYGYFGNLEMIYRQIAQLYGKKVEVERSGYVKIFERVKGVTVTGKASSEFVEINATIKTNQNRTFEYYAKIKVENGTYSVILPYSHDAGYEVKPITPYYFKSGETVKTLEVKEEDVLEGKQIVLDLW